MSSIVVRIWKNGLFNIADNNETKLNQAFDSCFCTSYEFLQVLFFVSCNIKMHSGMDNSATIAKRFHERMIANYLDSSYNEMSNK